MTAEVLVVDDEAGIRTSIAGILEDEGYRTLEAAESDQALGVIRESRPQLVILDIWLEGSRQDGLELLSTIAQDYPQIPVVMISGHGTIEVAVRAIRLGAYDFIEKPFKADRLLLVVERAIEAGRLRLEIQELRLRAGPRAELIGQSPQTVQLRQMVERVAPTGSRILITGPAGCGKEVVARQIHDASRRAEGAFVALNCAIMHPERLESELFGVVPGHEGAGSPGRIGTFERAHGGTLLLDEVADMPLETQGKILRVLQEQTFERVGGDQSIKVDVRVVASTNRDLAQLIAEGRFREDLFYRLNVVAFRVPPLVDRREDIPDLVDYFMRLAADSTGLPHRTLSADSMAALQAHDWPGNVRQLRNVVDSLVIMVSGHSDEPIPPSALPADIGAGTPAALAGHTHEEIMSLPLREAREVFERQYLESQVLRFSGNISRTATFVGMERSALHRKLRALGIVTGERAQG